MMTPHYITKPGRLATGMISGAAGIAYNSLKFICLFSQKHESRLPRPCGRPAFARICRYRRPGGSWQYSPAPGFRGVISQRKNFRKFIEKPREFIDIYRIFSKFHILEQADRLRHHTAVPRSRAGGRCGEMRSRLGGRSESVAMIFGATRGAGSENGFRPGEAKPTGGLSSIPHLRERPATGIAGRCCVERERGSGGKALPEEGMLKKPCGVNLVARTLLKFTPPLRGSQQDEGEARSRAGGGSFSVECPPTESAFAQTARPLRLAFPSGSQTLKGGVKFGTLFL